MIEHFLLWQFFFESGLKSFCKTTRLLLDTHHYFAYCHMVSFTGRLMGSDEFSVWYVAVALGFCACDYQ